MIEKSHRWHRTAVAAAAFALLGMSAGEVSALSLGRITVQSSLGEVLKAEIDVPSITPEEAASFKANVAAPAAFVAAGLEYNAAMSSLQLSLARKADGRAYIRLTSDRAINDPFIDIILEANWSTGRIVRDYTMLFDPPSLKQPAPAPTLAQTPAAASVTVPAKATAPVAAPVAATPVAPAPEPARPAVAAPKTPAGAAAKAVATEPRKSEKQVLVKPGDTASKIAGNARTSDVSLDQMLVALLRANPDAFLSGNLNRLRAGALLDLPSAEQAQAVSASEATQMVLAQSKDFNEFRRNLAGSAPKAAVEETNRKAAGKVQAKVEEKKPGSTATDKLTLSKGALQSKAADEAKLAKERADSEAAARAAELAKNIADLSKLSAASAKAAPAPVAAASQAGGAPALPAVAVAPPVAAAASAAASMPAAAAAKPAASAAAQPASAPVPVPVPEQGLLDQVIEDPTLPLMGGGLLALLGGFFWYRRRKATPSAPPVDSSFLESRLQPDSFFGASGGQHVDTAQDGAPASTSEGYTNSQVGSPDDVDPVAEADVYLAYGRDKQAEDILKEALRHNPERFAIHSKLLDIYAKRADAASFLATANTAFQLVGADSPEWARICELGLSIDPHNPLYQPGGATQSAFVSLEQNAPAPEATQAMAELPLGSTDVDLDLDFSADDAQASAALEAPGASLPEANPDATMKLDAQAPAELNSIDLDIPDLGVPAEAAPQAAPATDMTDLSLDFDDMDLGSAESAEPVAAAPDLSAAVVELPQPLPEPEAEPQEPAKANDGMLEFDLGSLSLDLGPSSVSAADDAGAAPGDSSLETKLALAEEFISIGDQDGARALIEEVVSEASGELREKAQRALANLS